MTRRMLPVVAIVIGALSLPAWAGNGYVGASYMDSSAEFRIAAESFDISDSGWKIFGGYDFIKYFGVEGTYYDLATSPRLRESARSTQTSRPSTFRDGASSRSARDSSCSPSWGIPASTSAAPRRPVL